LTRDDEPAGEFEGSLHHVVDLEGSFTQISVEGEQRGRTVRETLRSWGMAATVRIETDTGEIASETTVPIDLTVIDENGTPVRDWNGHVRVTVEGDARILPYTDAGEVLIARGEGRTYLQLGRTEGQVTIRATADALEPAMMAISPLS